MILGHKPLHDPEIQAEIFAILKSLEPCEVDPDSWDTSLYLNSFVSWIQQSDKNTVTGLDRFPHMAYCAGAYDAIQSFIHRHMTTKRIRFSRAEFVGSKIVCNNAGANWCYIEDAPFSANDALVLSYPFSGNGEQHPDHDQILSTCCELNIPVMIDMAYFGISAGMDFDITHHCITDIVFSLSKAMATQLRLGLRLTKNSHDDVIQVLSDTKIYNRISAKIGVELLKKYSHDWLLDRYLPLQQKVCQTLKITPTPTVTLALGDAVQHNEFWREGYFRICITDELNEQISL